MRIGILVTLLVLLTFPGLTAAAPNINFDKESHDYGRVLYGDTVTEEFVLTNTGDKTLVIEKLHASCGCTKAIKGSSEVLPKGTTKIIAAFDTNGLRPGKKEKTIFVHSNDPQRPVVKLALQAEVIKELNVDPPTLAKKLPGFIETVSFPLKITNSSDKAYRVEKLTSQDGTLQVTLDPVKIVVEPGSTVPFSIAMKLKNDPGRYYWMGRLLLQTNHPKENEIELRYLIKLE